MLTSVLSYEWLECAPVNSRRLQGETSRPKPNTSVSDGVRLEEVVSGAPKTGDLWQTKQPAPSSQRVLGQPSPNDISFIETGFDRGRHGTSSEPVQPRLNRHR